MRKSARFRARVMFQPLSTPLQGSVRFLLVPVPAPPSADFAVCFPRRGRYGVSTFRLHKYVGLGVCYRPGGAWVTKAYFKDAVPTPVTVWFKRNSHLRLL